MAYTSCAAEMAANIAQDCEQPIVGGYTGRGVYIARVDAPTLTRLAGNPRIISGITLASGKKAVVIDNVSETPFDGSTTELTTESGRGMYAKSVVVRIPLRGGAAAKDVVEPLFKSALGGIVILEKRDTVGDGSFEVIGVESGVRASAQARNENESNGDWQATLSTTENYAEYSFFDTDYATTLAKFEALLAQSF